MAEPISILLTDPVHPNNQHKTFPYAAGCVGAFAAACLGDQIDVQVFRTADDLGQAFRARRPHLLGFTNYVWNLELGYELIRQAKADAPDAVVVMGGPNYPTDADGQRAFLERYPLIDFYVYKEGEIPFLEMLKLLLAADLDPQAVKRQRPEVSALHYLVDGDLIAPGPAARQRDLDDFASPYLSGLMDRFFGRKDLVPLVQTKRGCPFQCTFCVEGESYYTKVASVTTPRFEAELEYIASRMAGGPPLLHIADSNFGMYAQDLDLCDIISAIRNRHGWPETIEVSTGKNRKERVIEAVRRTDGAMRFGPALQSTDKQTLVNIKRSNISETILMDMASAAMEMDQRSYTELILNLPGDTIATHLGSIQAAMDAGMQRIKMYPLVLLPGTEMANQETRERFALQTGFRVLPLCHGTHDFNGTPFPSVEVAELVIATNTMTFEDYLYCKRFELSVEIFYNDIYLEEIHGLMRALGLSMFDFVKRCHARFDTFPDSLKNLYVALDHGVSDNLWTTRDECLQHFRDPANLERYANEEYKNSLGTLKAIALLDHIEPILAIAREAVGECVAASQTNHPDMDEYLDELVEYGRLRRHRVLDVDLETQGEFRYAFDRILEQGFRVDPAQFRLPSPRTMRFWHDEVQAREIEALCAEVSNPVLRARSFIYPQTDPGTNPYLRRSRFC
jgi:radical SAM superfamily enzyme YgiQ (UPF0313 family)